MDDHIGHVREPFHEPILDHVRRGVRRFERRCAVEPDVEIHEDVVRRAARPDVVTAEHLRNRSDDFAHVVLGDDHLVGENARRMLSDFPSRITDEDYRNY